MRHRCHSCLLLRPVGQFELDETTPSGLSNFCGVCIPPMKKILVPIKVEPKEVEELELKGFSDLLWPVKQVERKWRAG